MRNTTWIDSELPSKWNPMGSNKFPKVKKKQGDKGNKTEWLTNTFHLIVSI